MDDVFDVAKLRRNWARAIPQQVQEISPALAGIDPARDLRSEFAETFARIEASAFERFPAEREAVAALLGEILTATSHLRAAPDAGSSQLMARPMDVDPEMATSPAHENGEGEIIVTEGDTDAHDAQPEQITAASRDDTEMPSPEDIRPSRHAMHQSIDAFEELIEAFTLMQGLTR